MKTVNAFVNKENYTAFTCPHCQKIHRVPVAAQKGLNHKIVSSCSCQKRFEVNLDCRQSHRKEVNLVGEVQNVSNGSGDWHAIAVTDLSMSGLLFKSVGLKEIEKGHRVNLRFTLEGQQANEIDKEARIIDIRGDYFRCEFLNLAYQENELGAYLFQG